jgi:predicted RNA-binding Zn-ribbon protein involved in translation (DUF1610 family)
MKILHLDIETAPARAYVWGLFNQNISINQIEEPGYTLCWAAKWHQQPNIYFSSIHHFDKQRMLYSIYELLDEADVVVHYNGRKFDIPKLNQEFLLNNMPRPSPVLQIDLLSTVRRHFKFQSNKLDFVAQQLGMGNKVEHKGMSLWRDCMAGDDEAWEVMRRYNIRDVELLEKVYDRLRPWISNHPNHGLFITEGEHVCPNCGSHHLQKRGTYYAKTLTYQRYRCTDCGSWSRAKNTDMEKERSRQILVGVN